MQVLRSLTGWNRPAVVSVGNFDGVHRAHAVLLRAVIEQAHALGAAAVAVSFEPHPSRILSPQSAPPLITPVQEKIRQIGALGLDALVLLPFTRDLSLLSPLEFVEQILVSGLQTRALHEGANFRFGHRHQGTIADLERMGGEFHFSLQIHPSLSLRQETVSSTRIRQLIAEGNLNRARWLLGRPFLIQGLIAPGRGIGRQRTVPTLNLQHYEELVPAVGVYLTCIELNGMSRAALTNVGVRPTFGGGSPLTIETHVLHPPADGLPASLGEPLRITFLRRLREERRFESSEALKAQIHADIAIAERYFRRLGLP